MKRHQLLVATVFGIAGAIAVWGRTARIVWATETSAEIVLDYTPGPRPHYVIVDLRGTPGSGSATTEGEADSVLVLLSGPLGDSPQIEVTTSTRVLGRLWTRRVVFGEK